MSKTRFVAHDGLPAFLSVLSQLGFKVLVPVEKPAAAKPSIVFAPWEKGMEFSLAKATVPPKETVLPECETLFTFKRKFSPEAPDKTWLQLTENNEPAATAVFACRTCDARGFAAFDKPFMNGLFKDPYYTAKREKLLVISLTCNSGCETCFCHWVGGGPTSPTGSDILITEIPDGYVFQAITDKGQEILEKTDLEDGTEKFKIAEQTRKAAWASLVPAPNLADAARSLKEVFTDQDFWLHWTDRCLSCGACTYFCPTCYCFNITDEGNPAAPKGGRRLRSWDNCMSSRYTREASGHNPRALKSQRMRNRVSHKFWTYPENWGTTLCSGCGRCIANCPVHLDIREIVLAAIEARKA